MKPARVIRPESFRKGFAVTLILVLGILIGVGGVFGLAYILKLNRKPFGTIITSNETKKASPLPSSDETANWKTFSDSKFNYSFKYPQDWFYESNSLEGTTSFFKVGSNPEYSDGDTHGNELLIASLGGRG